MRYSTSTISLFALCILSGCVWLKLFNEGASDTLQLTLFGSAVEITRGILSRRLGWSMEIYAITAAAAPLDYLLHKGSPSWRLLGVGPCDKRRHKQTRYGNCAPLQAHACYQYGTSVKPGFEIMADCYKAFSIPAKEASLHVQQCHPSVDLPWTGFESCLTASTELQGKAERSLEFPFVLVKCIERFGVAEQFVEVTENMETIKIRQVSNATKSAGSADSHMKCIV